MLNPADQVGVLGIDSAIDPPVQIARCRHFATAVWQRVADLADDTRRRRHRQPLHEVDLVRVDVERHAREQLVIKPFAAVAFRQMVRRRQVALIGALRRIGGVVIA